MNYFIFDLDGTLYSFNEDPNTEFSKSEFYDNIKENIYQFFVNELGFSYNRAKEEYSYIKNNFGEDLSLFVENTYKLSRYYYFEKTWNLDPKNYINKNDNVKKLFKKLNGRISILSLAPKIWVEKVLDYMEIKDYVSNIISGEPDIRKPNSEVFKQAIEPFQITPDQAISIGDQDHTDILPAKKIGMKTIKVGKESKIANYNIKKIDYLEELLLKEELI